MSEQKSPCVLQDLVPFGAAAQKALEKAPIESYDDYSAVAALSGTQDQNVMKHGKTFYCNKRG